MEHGQRLEQTLSMGNSVHPLKFQLSMVNRVSSVLLLQMKLVKSSIFVFCSGHVICIYTYNHEDKVDVMRTREHLRTMVFTEKLGYKTDAATCAGVYRATGHNNVCKYRC